MPRISRGPFPKGWHTIGAAALAATAFGCQPRGSATTEPPPILSWTVRSPGHTSPLGDLRGDPQSWARVRDRFSQASAWSQGYADLVLTGYGKDPLPPSPDPLSQADALLADLVQATLIDASDELRQAKIALATRSKSLEGLNRVQAPPWPPESVNQLVRRRVRKGDNPAPWLDTLAAQLVPDPAPRAWLRASWNRPRQPIDGATLNELAEAAGGRLAREPRFRAWLRGEWRAWARQKYRLIAREANESRS